MNKRVLLCRKCHGMARRLFGDHPIGGYKAYEYYIKEFIREQLGKSSRAQLDENEWEEVFAWLRKMLLIREAFAPLGSNFMAKKKGGR